MAIAPTRFSRVSIGWVTSTKSIVDADPGDTGATFSATGPVAFTGALTQTGAATFTSTVSIGGALTQDGAATFNDAVAGLSTASFDGAATLQSTLTVRGAATVDGAALFNSTASFAGNVTASSGILVGNASAINELVAISSATASINLPAINPLESSSVVTFGLSGLTRGDSIIVTPDANWSLAAAQTDLAYFASSSSTAGEGNFWAINSTLTAVNAGDTVFRFTRINHPSYL